MLANLFSEENSVNNSSYTPNIFSQENNTDSLIFSQENNNIQNNGISIGSDDINLHKNEDNEIKNNKKEEINNAPEIEKSNENDKHKGKKDIKKNPLNLTIVRVINRALELNENGELKLDGMNLFNIIEPLLCFIKKEMGEIMSKGDDTSAEEVNGLVKLLTKYDLLTKIKDFKIKEKEEDITDKNEIKYLKEELILFEEDWENNKKIRKEIRAEAEGNSEPINLLNITIQKFIIQCLKEQKKYFLRNNEENNIEIQPEKNEGKFLKKKRNSEDDYYKDCLSLEEEENSIKRKKYRADNILNMFKRNLIQQIFLDWINNGESNKNDILSKLDPAIFRTPFNFKGKKLKEIYSENISKKSKNQDKNHNIDVIKRAEGIKKIKLNLSFEQALKIFFYEKINKNEILENIQSHKNIIIDENIIMQGLKCKEEYIAEKSKGEKSCFEKKLRKILDAFEEEYLGK